MKVADARLDVILAGGLNHRLPWRHVPPPAPSLLRDNLPRNAKFWQVGVLDVVNLFQNILTSPIISQM